MESGPGSGASGCAPSTPPPRNRSVRASKSSSGGVPSAGWGARTDWSKIPSAVGSAVGSVVGSVAGMIQYQPLGEDGFGYDPVFYLPSYGMTMAQISMEEKNRISHRADAASRAQPMLQKLWADS